MKAGMVLLECLITSIANAHSIEMEKGRPDWFDFEIESIGVIPARELAKEAFILLKKSIAEWSKNDIVREKEDGVYRIVAESGGPHCWCPCPGSTVRVRVVPVCLV